MKDCQMLWFNEEIELVDFDGHYLVSDFHNDMAVVMNKDRKYGLVNKNGKMLIPCEYDEIPLKEGDYVRFNVYHKSNKPKLQASKRRYPDVRNAAIRVRKGDRWGLLSTNGLAILEVKYQSIKLTDNKLLYRIINEEGKSGLVKFDGKVLLPAEYEYIGRYSPHGLFTIGKNGVWGKMHSKGKIYWPKGY